MYAMYSMIIQSTQYFFITNRKKIEFKNGLIT